MSQAVNAARQRTRNILLKASSELSDPNEDSLASFLKNRNFILESDVTDKLDDQRKKKYPEKFHQMYANKRKLGSLQEY